MASAYNQLLRPLLGALGWKGQERHICEALPVNSSTLDLQAFCNTMAHLGYTGIIRKVKVKKIDPEWLPAIALEPNKICLIRTIEDGHDLTGKKIRLVFFQSASLPVTSDTGTVSLRHEVRRFEPLLYQVLLISLLIGGIALAPIMFNRAIYDHVIASGSTRGLPVIVIGVFVALGSELFLRHLRNQRLASFGGRIDHFVSCTVFERLLFLPPLYTERVAPSAQLSRLRDFENVREFFTGPLATLFFESPLIVIYLIVMACMTGWLVLVPILLLGAYGLLLLLMKERLGSSSRNAAMTGSQRQEFLLETVSKLHSLRLAGMEDIWHQRYRQISGQASLASFHSVVSTQMLETFSYILMSLGGIATLGFGVGAVIEGDLTTGALVAAMLLIWRIIAPMQIFCCSVSRLQQLKNSTAQVARLLSFPPEHNSCKPVMTNPKLKGHITFHRASLRYSPEMEPALLGVSFEIQPGQIIAIRGANGSGKSTLLKLVLGLYQPQNGYIRLDGVDLRQFDPVTLRQSIAYVPQHVDLFAGTVRDNLLLSNPVADEEDCRRALEEACALSEVEKLPYGLDTLIDGDHADSISYILRHRLNLARAYLKPAPIILFDEASYSLGRDNDEAFARKLASLRGHSTVLLVTHREDHMRLADQLLVMDKGELTHAGPSEQVLTALKGKNR